MYNIIDDWRFLFVTTYFKWYLLFLNCLANMAAPSYIISMVVCMSKFELEEIIHKDLNGSWNQVIQEKIKFALLDFFNLSILVTGKQDRIR